MVRYRTLQRILQKRIREGKNIEEAVADVTKENLKRKFSRADYAEESLDAIRKKTYSLSARKPLVARMTKIVFDAKRRALLPLIRRAFGEKGSKLGMLIIEPELFGHHRKVHQFLRELGVKPLFVKNFTFTKDQVYRIYEPRHMELHDFPLKAAILLNGPSQLIVFRHLPKSEYISRSSWLRQLGKHDPSKAEKVKRKLETATEQRYFDLLFKGSHNETEPGTLREEIGKKIIENAGYRKQVRGPEADAFDPYGTISNHYPHKLESILAGIHVPRDQNIENHAATLLSAQELYQIAKIAKGA